MKRIKKPSRRDHYYVTAWGLFFDYGNGWQRDPDLERPCCATTASIVKNVQPGVVLVEVSA